MTYFKSLIFLSRHERENGWHTRGARGEAARNEASNLHNFNFSLGSRGFEEQRTTARGLLVDFCAKIPEDLLRR